MRAYHAADAVPVALNAFSRCLTIELHPSASLVASRFPVVSIWENNIRNDDAPLLWRPEAALIIRPEQEVQVWRLPRGGYAFLTAIMDGQTFRQQPKGRWNKTLTSILRQMSKS